MKHGCRFNVILVAFITLMLLPGMNPTGSAQTKTYPDKSRSMTVIVPYPAGGQADTAARMMSPLLEKEMGIPVQVVNKPGAGGQVGFTEIARSRPDGYNIGYLIIPTVVTVPLDPDRKAVFSRTSFELLANQHAAPGIVAVRADSPYKTFKDLIEATKGKPGSIRITTAGILSDDHISTMMLEQISGAKFAIVHFNGSAPSRTAVLGGHVEVFVGNCSEIPAQVWGGEMRVLAIYDKKRSRFYPDAKTADEQGYPVFSGVHIGLAAPTGIPKEASAYLVETLKKVITSDEFAKRMEKTALTPKHMDPQAYSAFWSEFESGAKKWVEMGKLKK